MAVWVWLSGNALVSIKKVTVRRARLVLGWLTIHGYTIFVFNKATKVNSAFHISRVSKSSAGVLGWGEGGARSPVIPFGR